ncbi:MAG: PadR family transcriptional regulator [Candidatus Jordarchaeaceae archaeon]
MAQEKMKGFLSFLILWLVSKKSMTGVEITLELEKRKGRKLSPGTIYPVLKTLKDKGLLSIDENKSYSLTKSGINELKNSLNLFFKIFPDIDEMKDYLK